MTQFIVPDNPNAMIADANRYEPRSNDTVLDFTRHYGTPILPARCVPRLLEELRIRHDSGALGKGLIQLDKTDVLVLDDWGMGAINSTARSDRLEIIDDHAANKATIITSQLPVKHWHAWIGDTTIADAILDRIMQRNDRFTLTDDSLRTVRSKNSGKENSSSGY